MTVLRGNAVIALRTRFAFEVPPSIVYLRRISPRLISVVTVYSFQMTIKTRPTFPQLIVVYQGGLYIDVDRAPHNQCRHLTTHRPGPLYERATHIILMNDCVLREARKALASRSCSTTPNLSRLCTRGLQVLTLILVAPRTTFLPSFASSVSLLSIDSPLSLVVLIPFSLYSKSFFYIRQF